jgi:alpha-1,6-mannosyltransferase
MSEQAPDTRGMRVIGFATLGLYLLLAFFLWTAWSFRTNRIDEVVVVLVTAALVALYFRGIKYARRAGPSVILAFAIAIGIIGFMMPPFDSTDVFFYMATGWQQSHYGVNPYSGLLRNVEGASDDPMIQNKWMARNRNPWLDIPLPYGFLFALVARTVAWLGRGNFWLTLELFSFLNLLMHAGTALFLWKAGQLLPDGNGKVLLYLYSWNPFVVLQYLADLHNDIIVAFLIVAAAYLVFKDRPLWSVPLLVAAGLIKYVTLALVPFALIFVIRHKGWREGLRGLLLSAALVVVTALPFLAEIDRFKYRLIFAQVSESTGSLHAFSMYLFRTLGWIWPALTRSVSTYSTITQVGLWVLFAAFVAGELYRSWREKSAEPLTMIRRWTSVLFALIFVASSQFYAWYIGMMFPLAVLTHGTTMLADLVIGLSGTHLLSFTFLRRKAIGYFVLATLVPVLYLLASKARRIPARALTYF